MSTETVKADDKQYDFHPDWAAEGDIILISEDDKAFKTESYYLKVHSPVLRDMLGTLLSPEQVVRLPPTHSDILVAVLQALVSGVKRLKWDIFESVMGFDLAYECTMLGEQIFLKSLTCFSHDKLFPSFVQASRLNSAMVAQQILLGGGFVKNGNGKLRCHGGNRGKELQIDDWSVADAESIGGEWWLALAQAQLATGRRSDSKDDEDYWRRLAAIFGSKIDW